MTKMGSIVWPQNRLQWGRNSDSLVTHTQQKLTQVPPPPRATCPPRLQVKLWWEPKLDLVVLPMVWDSQYLSWGECYSSPKNTYLRRSNMKRVQPVRHTRWHKHKAPLLQHLIGRINVCKMIKISVLILSALWLESSEKILCLLRVFCLSKLI